MKKSNYNLHVTTYFTYEDKNNKVDNFDGDYSFIEVRAGKKLIASYGDYYHDKGEYKLDGFIEAWKMLTKKLLGIDIKVIAEDKMSTEYSSAEEVSEL